MRIRVRAIRAGQHPSERLLSIRTSEGDQSLVVDSSSIRENSIEVGWPLTRKEGKYLVELPRETFNGLWRVWVLADQVVDEELEGAT